nr:ABC transporter substrate-binding protein [Halomarina sp. PSRA2]
MAGLAGCLGGGGGNGGGNGSGGGGSEGTLEIAHWWADGDGNEAINALVEGFQEEYPDVELDNNLVAGGAGENLQTEIKTRIQNDEAPSTWQTWPGAALQEYVEADLLEDLSDSVWSENGMEDAYLEGPKQAAKPDGTYVTVPLNIHRLNNLFYNVEVVEEAGADPTSVSTPSELVEVMQQISDAGMVGMANQTATPWSTLQLWAQVLMGEYGVDAYTAFTEGEVEANEDAVKGSLDIVKQYSEFFNEDASSLEWTEANAMVIDGEAGLFHQGDWAAGAYGNADDFEFEEHWNHVPFPGTEGAYALNMDSFPFPANNPSPDATEKFLRYVGTVDAQERFNPLKGSIPPRTDVSTDGFGPFLTKQIEDFQDSSDQPPSIAHGLAVRPGIQTSLEEATKAFTTNWNVDDAYSGFVSAFDQ